MTRVLVAGVDTSTHSTKVRITDAATGEQVRFGQAKHPDADDLGDLFRFQLHLCLFTTQFIIVISGGNSFCALPRL